MIPDLHIHSKYSDGEVKIDTIKKDVIRKGLRLIGIADHALGWEGNYFFSGKRDFEKYSRKIESLSDTDVTILKGLECDIGSNGEIVTTEEIVVNKALEGGTLDYVIASFHPERQWWGDTDKSIRAVLKAVTRQEVNILGHPLSPVYNNGRNTEYALRLYDALVLENAKGHRVCFELNRKEYFLMKGKSRLDELLTVLTQV